MLLRDNMNADFTHNFQFKITIRLKYLGEILPKDPKLIFKSNFLVKVERLKEQREVMRDTPAWVAI